MIGNWIGHLKFEIQRLNFEFWDQLEIKSNKKNIPMNKVYSAASLGK
jgi:hypothetical protein